MSSHQRLLLPAISSVAATSTFRSFHEEAGLDGVQYILHLLWIGQSLCKQTTGTANRLCEEVKKVTHEKAQLILRHPGTTQKISVSKFDSLMSFPVQFGDIVYGTLCIAPDGGQPPSPALPFAIAQLLAQTCAWLLYTFEQSTFLQNQCQHLNNQTCGTLTKRERQVLALMCLGHDQKSIADKLCISPATVGKHRQHIYEQLGVHNERDALLTAYQFGIFSILEQNTP